MYAIEQWTNSWLAGEWGSPWLPLLVFAAGVLTSFTPCTLSMLPITIGYLGGFSTPRPGRQVLLFVLGFVTILTALGLGAALLGKVYGQTGWGWSLVVGTIAVLMGLSLLEVMPLPQWNSLPLEKYLPPSLRSYGVGLSFGLASSPCSTPVLATLLAWVTQSQSFFLGSLVLFIYALGTCVPLLLAGLFMVSLRSLLALRQWTVYINYCSGVVLLGFGVYKLLATVPHLYS
ncbi:MAG: cytochrome c biogenesis protein CcdA [Pseudanabaenaceae cyanobacterium]